MAIGNAASEAAVVKAKIVGSFKAKNNLNKFTFVKAEAMPRISAKNTIKAAYKVRTNFNNGMSISKPKAPTVYAMAPKIPIGEIYIT